MSTLIDRHGRIHTDLRVSLTDRCSLRCTYCMPEQGMDWIPRADTLQTDELLRLVAVAVDQGVTTVRLTGGEPLLRPDVVDIVRAITALPGSPEVALTTNGLRLPGLAAPLVDAGLSRVNISLDTMDRDRFLALTRRDRLIDTLAGIAAAKAAGLDPVKINSVLMRGINDDEAPTLLLWALEQGLHLRFIEQMPLDPQHSWDAGQMVTADEIQERLVAAGFALTPLDDRGAAPAELFHVNGGPQTVGIIGSMTRPFCGDCNRVRLTSDGQWRNCLFGRDETDLRTPLRSGASDHDLATLMRRDVAAKRRAHGTDDTGFVQPDRPMSAIGG
ncbi:MAG: GTP 3',8-cyclase MoaA [Candidatus Nanopelagicales bacterium]